MASKQTSCNGQTEGVLSKWKSRAKGWKFYWCVLDHAECLLTYYKSREKAKSGSRRSLRLGEAIVGIDGDNANKFTVRVDKRSYFFQAQSRDDCRRWVHAVQTCLQKPLAEFSDPTLPEAPHEIRLEKQIAETEGCFQLLRDSVDTYSSRLNPSEEATRIGDTAQSLLRSLRQCLDLIKDYQLNGGPPQSSINTVPPSTQPPSSHPPLTNPSSTIAEENLEAAAVSQSRSEEVEEKEEERGTSTKPGEGGGVAEQSLGSVGVARDGINWSCDDNSDSSSDVSEEYHSAEELDQRLPLPPAPTHLSPRVSLCPLDEEDPSDVEEEEELVEEELSGTAHHRSIVSHIISQLRVGRDLELHRISLPAFILEKRSLLEMFSHFLSHANLFANIPDHSTAEERMIAITRYYLSAFHTARGSAIAKKPYNPILGEVSKCYWDLPNGKRTPPDEGAKSILESGPVPYASYDSVTFIAEQVSHHPPISALYVECPTKRMYCEGSVYTKTRFLGLSVGVYCIGTIYLHLLDYDEVYTISLPNTYARSVLTIPWMEMGGKVTIDCQKSGYKSNIEFHCKPFYGGKKHRVTAEIVHLSVKKPVLKVEGEWNGVMYTKHRRERQDVFLDTIKTPAIRKKWLKIAAQDPEESRKLWNAVTVALDRGDLDAANDAKHELEERQRAELRERQRTGEEWVQKYFEPFGDEWRYRNPLTARLARLKQTQPQ